MNAEQKFHLDDPHKNIKTLNPQTANQVHCVSNNPREIQFQVHKNIEKNSLAEFARIS